MCVKITSPLRYKMCSDFLDLTLFTIKLLQLPYVKDFINCQKLNHVLSETEF